MPPVCHELCDHLSTTQARLSFMEKLAGLGYWELDVKKRRLFCSDEACKIAGIKNPASAGIKLQELMRPTEYKKFVGKLRRLYHRGRKFNMEVKILTPAGLIRYCQIRADLFEASGTKIAAGTLQDLTRLIETGKKLAAAHRKAEKLAKEKSYFLAQASHDLRQPMHALSLYLDMFQDENFNREQHQLWQKICRSAESLKLLLNNVLDLSKLDYGGTRAEIGCFNAGVLLSDLGREFADIAECKNLRFEFSICNCLVKSDAFLVERMLRNLLSNAFKFASGSVSIVCREYPAFIRLEVADDGVGIDPEDQKHIFEEFYRGKNSIKNQTDGAGLGLAIVWRIAKLLQAPIKVRSAPGKGSTFIFRLPRCLS